jgi:SAM-dependent methyltransferase
MTDYVLASKDELERLQLQARVWEPEADAMLDRIGVQAGWLCLDMGCGAMGILGPLARRVGPHRRVVGVDLDKSLLAAAQAYAKMEKLANVEILKRDVMNIGLPAESFDLVHERFVFPHVSAETLLQEMLTVTLPGGYVVLQEPDHSSWSFYPPSAKWRRLIGIVESAFALRGDINIGRRTYFMLRQAGLGEVTIRASVLALQDNHPCMRMAIVGANAMRQRILSAGLATDAELDDLLGDVEQRASDPETFQITFIVTQVWGRKGAAQT